MHLKFGISQAKKVPVIQSAYAYALWMVDLKFYSQKGDAIFPLKFANVEGVFLIESNMIRCI